MFLIYLFSGIVVLNLFIIFIVKNKYLSQFIFITSFLLIALLTPKYLVEYDIISEDPFEKIINSK